MSRIYKEAVSEQTTTSSVHKYSPGMYRGVSGTLVTVNGNLATARDCLNVMAERVSVENNGGLKMVSESMLSLVPRSVPVDDARILPYRNRRIGAVVRSKNDALVLLPTIRREEGNHITATKWSGQVGHSHIVDGSVMKNVATKGELHAAVQVTTEPLLPEGAITAVKRGEHLTVVVALLASLAVEHMLVPIATHIVPPGNADCVVNLSAADLKKATYCVTSKKKIDMLTSGSVVNRGTEDEPDTAIPIYIPSDLMREGGAVLAAIGRRNGPYRNRIRTCWHMPVEGVNIFLVTPNGLGNTPLPRVASDRIWHAISEALQILEQYNGVKAGVFQRFLLAFLNNTPLYDRVLRDDLGCAANAYGTIPHAREGVFRANEWDQAIEYGGLANAAGAGVAFTNIFPNVDAYGAANVAVPGLENQDRALIVAALQPETMRQRGAGNFWVAGPMHDTWNVCPTWIDTIPFTGEMNAPIAAVVGPGNHSFRANPVVFLAAGHNMPGLACTNAQMRQLDRWFLSGNAKCMLIGQVAFANLPLAHGVAACVNAGALAAGDVGHYAGNGYHAFANPAAIIAWLAAAGNNELVNLSAGFFAGAPVPAAGASWVIKCTLQDNGACDADIKALYIRNLNLPNIIPAPLPAGFGMVRNLDQVFFDSVVVQGVSTMARGIMRDAVSAAATAVYDGDVANVWHGTAMQGLINQIDRGVALMTAISTLFYRKEYDAWTARSQERYEATLAAPVAYSTICPKATGYLGGLPQSMDISIFTGWWPLFYLQETQIHFNRGLHPTIISLRESRNVAHLVYALRSCTDLAFAWAKPSMTSLYNSTYSDNKEDWVQATAGRDYDARVVTPAPIVQATKWRMLSALSGIEAADLCVPDSTTALPELYVSTNLVPLALAAHLKLWRCRVPEALKNTTVMMMTDSNAVNRRPTLESCALLKNSDWSSGLRLPPVHNSQGLGVIHHDLETELTVAWMRNREGTVIQYTMRDHVLKAADEVVFNPVVDDGFRTPPCLRYSPGHRITARSVGYVVIGVNMVFQLADITTMPEEIRVLRPNSTSATSYRVEGNTYVYPTNITQESVLASQNVINVLSTAIVTKEDRDPGLNNDPGSNETVGVRGNSGEQMLTSSTLTSTQPTPIQQPAPTTVNVAQKMIQLVTKEAPVSASGTVGAVNEAVGTAPIQQAKAPRLVANAKGSVPSLINPLHKSPSASRPNFTPNGKESVSTHIVDGEVQ